MRATPDSAKGGRNVIRCILAYLKKLWSPIPLPINQNLTTEVTTNNASIIRLELNLICDKHEGDRVRETLS